MIITLDFETYYDSEYSLKKLSTEEYIRDPRFQVIGVGISVNGATPRWFSGHVGPVLHSLPWNSSSLLAHHTHFDSAILGWVFGIYPALYLDTMGMARALQKNYRGASLHAVAKLLGLGVKGDYVVKAKGKRLEDFAPYELKEYGEYCCNDVTLTTNIYKQLKPQFPNEEILVQDKNIRLFTEPMLRFDEAGLKAYRKQVVEEKQEKLSLVAKALGLIEPDEAKLKTSLASNPQLADLLIQQGVDPPKKLNKKGKETWAFAKSDEAFMELLEHDDPTVQAIISARLGVRSTIEETRAERFLDIATRGAWPVYYFYYGAGTSRFSGGGNANPQNLKRRGRLRDSILPPPGHVILTGDLSQIECRKLNYIAGQNDIVEAFRLHDQGLGPNVYCLLAEKVYNRPVVKSEDEDYMVGKVGELSLGYAGGRKALKRMLFSQAGITMEEAVCGRIVDVYRSSHRKVQALWDEGNSALKAMMRGNDFAFGRDKMLRVTAKGIELPNGLHIFYPELSQEMDPESGETWFEYSVYEKGRTRRKRIHGAMVIQNINEALCRLILTRAWLRIAEKLRVVLHTHDELVCIVPEDKVEWGKEIVFNEMTQPIPWAPDLPLHCDVKAGRTYGEAKKG